MSLEQSLSEVALGLQALAAAIVASGGYTSSLPPAPAVDAPKKTRAKKEDAPAAAAAADILGNPAGTTYWHNAKHGSVYRVVPGDGSSPLADSVEVDTAKFVELQAEFAKRLAGPPTGTVSTVSASGATIISKAPEVDDPFAEPTAVAIDFATVRAALMKIVNDDAANGRTRVAEIIATQGVKMVADLAKASNDVLAAVHAAATAA